MGEARTGINTNLSQNKSKLWKTGIFSIAHLINDTYPNLYPVLLPILMAEMHFGTAQAGLISTVTSLSSQLLQPFGLTGPVDGLSLWEGWPWAVFCQPWPWHGRLHMGYC